MAFKPELQFKLGQQSKPELQFTLEPEGVLTPIYLEEINEKRPDKSWSPEPGITKEEDGYFGQRSRYSTKLDDITYDIVIRRSLHSKDAYKAIIVRGGSAMGGLNYRGFYTGKDKAGLEAIIAVATPSNRKKDPELAKLADLAKKILKTN